MLGLVLLVLGPLFAGLMAMPWGAVVGAEPLLSQRPENRAPVFSEGASTTRRVAENTAAGHRITAPGLCYR